MPVNGLGARPRPLRLEPGLQHYAWGDTEFIPRLLGICNAAGLPHAELWLGAHPRLPSRVDLGGDFVPLDELLDRNGNRLLGPEVAGRFGRLPYLLKVLAVARPLSIQVHPTREQAEAGFRRESSRGIALSAPERGYRDRDHKPELLVAVTDVHALSGFRPLEEIAETVVATPELHDVVGDFRPSEDNLRALFGRLMSLPQDRVDALLDPLLDRARRDLAGRELSGDDVFFWLLRADGFFSSDGHRDRGLFAFLLLNMVHLVPGQGLFTDAGTLHAYLDGVGVEVMASSDNVVRGGLTSKHVDLPGLLEIVQFRGGPPRVLEATRVAGGPESLYRTPAAEFELSRIDLAAGQSCEFSLPNGGTMLLVLALADGECIHVAAGEETIALGRGGACLIPHGVEARLESSGEATVFKATVPAGAGDPRGEIADIVTGCEMGGEESPGPRPPGTDAIQRNVRLTGRLLEAGQTAETIGIVSGSTHAQAFWRHDLGLARETFGARIALSFHEDLPVNQALGVLLLWQRLREELREGEGALFAFTFGEGTRASPLTEAENGQKPAIATFVTAPTPTGPRYLPMVELAMRCFVPVQQYLRRSGFEGLVIKWGDEIQIPTLDLSGRDPFLEGADVVRFVSVRVMTEDDARHKDWVGVDTAGRVTAFIPRRPLEDMERLADRGLLQRREGTLRGGINLGSIAISYDFLDALLQEFSPEVNDTSADRRVRPDLDPQFFTALTIATLDDPAARDEAWRVALAESEAMRRLSVDMPGIVGRLRRVIGRFRSAHSRAPRIVAMDFGRPYWGDIGQHSTIYDFYMSLNDPGPAGEITRAMASVPGARDAHGNIVVGDSVVSDSVKVRDSVLLNAQLPGEGHVERSVLVGTRAGRIRAQGAFDVLSTVPELSLEPRSGTYRVVSDDACRLGRGERGTTLFTDFGPVQMRVEEGTDLRDRAGAYDTPILGNPLSFRTAHEIMIRLSPQVVASRRERLAREVWTAIKNRHGVGPSGR